MKVDVVMMLKFLIVGLLLIFTCIKKAAIGKALDASFGRKIFHLLTWKVGLGKPAPTF